MHKTILHTLWGVWYILCACLGFIPERTPGVQGLLTAASLVFFLPPALLLARAGREKDRKELRLVGILSGLSLALTALFLALAIATAPRDSATLVNAVLAVVSVPMYCSGVWALSIFLWAGLLLACLEVGRRIKAS